MSEYRTKGEAVQRVRDGRLREALDALPDVLIVLSAVRNEAGHIIDFAVDDANRRGEEMCGLPHDSFAGLRLAGLPDAARQLPDIAAMAEVVASGRPLEQPPVSTDSSRAGQGARGIVPWATV
ncbi:hypothetical protein BH09GEM1_BH09GEM1_24300 [soil metagenome]